MKRDHMQVLKTLHDAGQLSRQSMKSIRGQILGMRDDNQREQYLKIIIKRSRTKDCTDRTAAHQHRAWR